MIMNQKIWGETCELFRSDTVSVHLLNVKKGGVCSWHYHQSKYNQFYVISGKLSIRELGQSGDPGSIQRITVLLPGDIHKILPGHYHRHEFEGLEDSVAIETTFVKNDPDDVTRLRVGYLI